MAALDEPPLVAVALGDPDMVSFVTPTGKARFPALRGGSGSGIPGSRGGPRQGNRAAEDGDIRHPAAGRGRV